MGRYPVSELTSRAPPSYPAAPPVEVTLVTFFRKTLMRRDAANYALSLRCRSAVASPAAPLLNIGDGCIDGADNFICAYAAFYGRCANSEFHAPAIPRLLVSFGVTFGLIWFIAAAN